MFNFLKKDFKIVEKHKIWFSISFGIFVLGIIFFTIYAAVGGSFSKGLNLGTDFTGGTQLDVVIGSDMNDDNAGEIKQTILDTLRGFGINDTNQIQRTDNGYTIVYRAEKDGSAKTDLVLNGDYSATTPRLSLKGRLIETVFDVKVNDKDVENEDLYVGISVQSQTVTPKVDSSVVLWALLAVAVVFILVLIYTFIRYEISSGAAAILAALHGVIIMLAVVIIFNVQINTAFMAACIMALVYSLVCSIVLFDHIKESSKKVSMQDKSAAHLVNNSVKKTLNRTIITTAAVLFMLVMLLIIGTSPIRGFAFSIILGLLAGAYSSVLLVGTGWALYKDKQIKKSGKREFFVRKIFKRREKVADIKNETE